MEVKTIEVYTLWNEERQCELTMTLGRVAEINNNTAWRWKLQGKHIPFPVRSNTWFEGFQSGVMIEYMRKCGYEVDAIVNMCTGKAHVFNRRVKNEPDALFKANMATLARQSYANRQNAIVATRHAFGYALDEAAAKIDDWIDELG